MAAQDADDFLDDELINQYIVFPPEVISAIDQVCFIIVIFDWGSGSINGRN